MTRTTIGIDLGTTFSLAAIVADGKPVVLPNALGETLTPSAVSVTDDHTVLVGAPARARATTHPKHTALAFKRDMGLDRKITLGKRGFTPQELSALVLAELKRDAEAALGRAVDEAVVTVPAYFGDAQRQATRDAAAIAGIHVERIINEPTAAAMAYGLHERHRELKAVVLDLGGGTFDVTVLEILEGVIEIQASSGDTRLGGEDFDAAIVELVVSRLPRDQQAAMQGDAQVWARLKEAAELAKKRLSDAETTRFAVFDLQLPRMGAIHVEQELTRADVDAVWSKLLDRMRAPISRALKDASLSPSKVDEVLLVGGSTRMPCVGKLATQLFGRLPLRTLPPDEAVALGAAVQAALKAGDAALDDMIVTDVAPFSLGIATSMRRGNQIINDLFTPIIERGTVIPASREQSFHTITDDQTSITFPVFQGEHALASDNKLLGSYTIKGLEPLPAGEHVFRVRFTYDLNGILEVDMTSVRTGKTETLVIEGAPGRMTKHQITEARKAMERLKFHPREALPNATVLARADALYIELVGEPREELGRAIASFRLVLDRQDEQVIASERSRLARVIDQLRR